MSVDGESCGEKCFVIMPISDQGDYEKGHFDKVYEQIFVPAIKEAGYEAYRVDENKISDSIIGKIFDGILHCEMALCDLSNRNPNVLYELGVRQAYNKPVVLVQDEKTEKIFDVSVISTVFYDSNRLYENVIKARENIKNAILSTRDGKETSLIQYVNATTAEYSESVDQKDGANIMLKSILNEISDIKRSRDYIDYIKRDYFRTVKYTIIKHSGMTKKMVYDKIESMKRIFGKKIQYKNNGDRVFVEIYDIETKEIEEEIIGYINKYIGEIIE
ncbi:MAG: hypothetical protein PHD70_14515 [Anaerostipes sp.]|nr:hypothetical protein [Anaerostipes sp.]